MESLKCENRIMEFEKLGYGMFVHFGLYSQMGQGEWIQNFKKIDKNEYKKLMSGFTAKDFDAKQLAAIAKAAGMKYITLTTRHHEGFSLYDTRGLCDYDAPHSPAGRDLVQEFVTACREEGLVPFFYHTTLDWYQEDFEQDFDAYLEYLRKSVELLCREYGQIGGFWFDGNWSKPDADWKLDELYGTIRTYQPEAMIINNTGINARGELGHPEIDSVTFEQDLPRPLDRTHMKKYITGEMCCTVNDHWGYGKHDLNYKSPAQIIEMLCKCKKVGANLLLNIGPDPYGKVDELSASILKASGAWMDAFGESIYLGKPDEIYGYGDNFGLKSETGDLYLFIFHLPIEGDPNVTLTQDGLLPQTFSGIMEELEEIHWMDNGEKLTFIQDADRGILTVNTTSYHYGENYVVRVAKATL